MLGANQNVCKCYYIIWKYNVCSTGDALLPFLEAELSNLIMLDILTSRTLLGFNCNYITYQLLPQKVHSTQTINTTMELNSFYS